MSKKIAKRVQIDSETIGLVTKYAKTQGVTFSTVVEWCLASQIFKPETNKKKGPTAASKAFIPALGLALLLMAPALATEGTDIYAPGGGGGGGGIKMLETHKSLIVKPGANPGDPPIITEIHSDGSEHVIATEPVAAEPVKKTFKTKHPKLYRGIRKTRFLLVFAMPFINLGANILSVVL